MVAAGIASAAKERRKAGLKRGDKAPSGKVSTTGAGKTRDKIGAYVGMSGRTYEKAKEVVEAGKTRDRFPKGFGNRSGQDPGPFRKAFLNGVGPNKR